MTQAFDESFDVVVVGYGFAGAVAQSPRPTPKPASYWRRRTRRPAASSICSCGSIRGTRGPDDAFPYLKATNAGRTPDDVLRALADGMKTSKRSAHARGGERRGVITRETGAITLSQATDTFLRSENHTRSRDTKIRKTLSPSDRQAIQQTAGACSKCWKTTSRAGDRRACRASARNASSPIAGARCVASGRSAEPGRRPLNVKATARRHLGLRRFRSGAGTQAAVLGEDAGPLGGDLDSNTGDGIRMAQDLGAHLWHMWHFHGSYGFRHPDPRYRDVAIRAKRLPDWFPGTEATSTVKMRWIVVDQDGRRYMNECTPYTQDTSHRPMELYDTHAKSFRASLVPRVRRERPQAVSGRRADLQKDRARLRLGAKTICAKSSSASSRSRESAAELARPIGCDPATLEATLERWNEPCRAEQDADFGRPPGSMCRSTRRPTMSA